MNETPRLLCETCKAEMRRVPQTFTWGHRPFDVLLDRLETKYRENRYRRSLSK
jgi:predicted secreted Zn-dependent protease